MKRHSFWTRSVASTVRFLIPALLVVLVVSGCAPKRVIYGETEPRPLKQKVKPVEKATGLPAPQAHGKVETPTVHEPVMNLELGSRAVTLARNQLNKPYQWGAHGPEKFDCSGLVYYVFGSLDVSMPRVSLAQSQFGLKVEKNDLLPGDLVFFVTSGKDINHVGIYVGGARFIHAPRRYSPVRYDSLNNSWWRQRFKFGRRISG